MNLDHLKFVDAYAAYNLTPESEGLHKELGVRAFWLDEEGRAYMQMDATGPTLNPFGSVHGGSIFALCDMAAECCVVSRGRLAVTLDSHIHFYRPAKPGMTLTAVAEIRKDGKKTAVCVARTLDETDQVIAEASFTFYYIK
jgi:acyl-CoA thioesterase